MTDKNIKIVLSEDELEASRQRALASIMPFFKILDVQTAYASAASSDMLIVVFYGPTQASSVANLLVKLDTIARTNQRRVNLMTIVRQGAPMPENAVRKALSDAYKYLIKEGVDIQGAIVFDGDGVKASIVQSIVLGMSLIANMSLPVKVFSKTEGATTWFGPRLESLQPKDYGLVDILIQEMDRRHGVLTRVRTSNFVSQEKR